MPDNLQQAIDALQAGDKKRAQGLLSSIIQANPRNEMAWYWMARTVDDPERKKECLARVLAINPDNQQAARELLQLQQPAPIEIERPPAQQPAATLPKKKKAMSGRGIAWLIIAGLMIFLGVLLCRPGKVSDTPEHTALPTVSSGYTVKYEVVGVSGSNKASVTYENAQDGTEQRDIMLPWSKTYTMERGTFAYISAQNDHEYGGVACRIYVDGVEWKHSESKGAYVIASCSGSVGR